jgi:hypothetical protein
MRKALDNVRQQMPKLVKASLSDLLKNKTGRRRRRFLDGWHQYWKEGLKDGHSRIECMQKLELHPVEKLAGKADRAIQFRTVAFNAALSQFLKPVEHYLFAGTSYQGGRWCAKGLTTTQRALLLLDHSHAFKDPIFVLADHKTFDAHFNKRLIRECHRFYKKLWNYEVELCRLLECQVNNRGRTTGGIRYRVKGTRMSGDVDTALGNSIGNFGMLAAWLGNEDARIMLDGDDSVIVMERSTLSRLPDMADFMLNFGMRTIFEVTDKISEAEFCQARIVMGPTGPYYCGNP